MKDIARRKRLRDNDFERSSSSEELTAKTKKWLEMIGASTILLVVMGVPAAVSQYSSFNIPLALLSYRRILEAGIVPTLIIISFISYLLYVERQSEGKDKQKKDKESLLFTIPAFPFIIPLVLITLFFALSLYSFMLWAFGWIVTRPLIWLMNELELNNITTLIIGSSIVAVIVLFFYFRNRVKKQKTPTKRSGRKKKTIKEKNKRLELNEIPPFYDQFQAPNSFNQWLINFFIFYLALPLIMVGIIYFDKLTFSFYGISWPIILKARVIWIVGLSLGIAYAHCMILITTSTIRNLKEEDKDKLRLGRKISYLLFVLFYVFIYSAYLYPNLPRIFGGGKPQVVNVLIRSDLFPQNLFSDEYFPDIKKDNIIELSNVYLIDISSNDIIICSTSKPKAHGFLLPRQSVTALHWR